MRASKRRLKNFRRFLRDNPGSANWGYGRRDDLSPEAELAWSGLDEIERILISRFNHFKNLRDNALYRLNKEGIPSRVLAELSGLSRSSCEKILCKEKKDHE